MLRRFLAVLFLVVAGLVVMPSGPAWACSCGIPQRDGDLVVVGVAERVDKPWLGEDLRVRLRVESVERGSAGERVEITTAEQSPSCGYGFQEGHRYRVYANEGSTTSCEGNEDLGFAEHPAAGPPWAVLGWALGAGVLLVAALILFRLRRTRP